jgi:muconolactone delta-isomerase
MQFISITRRKVDQFPAGAFTPELIAAERQRVRELYAVGILRQVWARGDVPGAVLLWEAANEVEVRDALATLPLFEAGLLEIVSVMPLKPYPGFGSAH